MSLLLRHLMSVWCNPMWGQQTKKSEEQGCLNTHWTTTNQPSFFLDQKECGESTKSANATTNAAMHAVKDCHASKLRKHTNTTDAERVLWTFPLMNELSPRCTCYREGFSKWCADKMTIQDLHMEDRKSKDFGMQNADDSRHNAMQDEDTKRPHAL